MPPDDAPSPPLAARAEDGTRAAVLDEAVAALRRLAPALPGDAATLLRRLAEGLPTPDRKSVV